MTGGGGADDEVAEALRSLDAARRRFVAVVGHELRTPLTTLGGLVRELEREVADLPESRLTQAIVPALARCARRAESLLDDLLLATDISTALPVADPEPIELVAVAQAAWDSMDVGVDLVLLGDREATAMLRPPAGDWMLERVLDNARRYGEPPFGLEAVTCGDRVRLTVSSGGPPLAEDDLALAFEVFYRGEAAVTRAPGFGLGLPVARALARQHGGDVTLSARRRGGLDVTIEVPAAG